MESRIMSTREAAAYTGISAQMLRRYVREGRLRAIQLGDNTSPFRFRQSTLDDFMTVAEAQTARKYRSRPA